MIRKRHKNMPKTLKIRAPGHHPLSATLRPISKTSRAVLASLTMALLVFSMGFGNIFLRPRPKTRRVEKRKGENRLLQRGS